MDMRRAIVESSNVYFYSLANELGVDTMHDFMKPLGFGQYTGIDINGEVRGILPSQEWKKRYYKRPEQQKWYAGETISLGIGQGYNSFTMLQLAQAMATLANNGVKHKPQLVIATQDAPPECAVPVPAEPPVDLGLQARERGGVWMPWSASRRRAPVDAGYLPVLGYVSGGKTGTAQAVSLGKNQKYNASSMEEHQRDHCALRRLCAGRRSRNIALGGDCGKRGLRFGLGCADCAPRVRLLAVGPVPQRRRPGGGEQRAGDGPDWQAPRCQRVALGRAALSRAETRRSRSCRIRANTTTMKTLRTKPVPCLRARWVPAKLPAKLATAITTTKCHHTWPLAVNSNSAAALDAVLSNLALADAFKKS